VSGSLIKSAGAATRQKAGLGALSPLRPNR
jgi:hypothetical protein